MSRAIARTSSKLITSTPRPLPTSKALESVRPRVLTPFLESRRTRTDNTRRIHTTAPKMSFSNTNTGNKTADPYVATNIQDPSLKEKVEDLVNFVNRNKFCLMTTKTPDGLLASRCMAVAAKEGHGVDFIFHANSESGKTDDLDANPEVNLGFLNNSGEWASVSGTASVETDREKVRKYYSPSLKAWIGDLGDGKHDGGPEDPRIVVIKVKSKTAQFAIANATIPIPVIGQALEVAKGIVTGEAPKVNKLVYLSESEVQQARSG